MSNAQEAAAQNEQFILKDERRNNIGKYFYAGINIHGNGTKWVINRIYISADIKKFSLLAVKVTAN